MEELGQPGKTYFFDRTSGRSVWEIPETAGLLRGGKPRLAFSEERTGSAVSPPRIMPAGEAEAVAARSAEAVRAKTVTVRYYSTAPSRARSLYAGIDRACKAQSTTCARSSSAAVAQQNTRNLSEKY